MLTQSDIVAMFFEYVTLLAPLVVAFLFVSVLMSWIKKLADVFSGKGW